MISKKKVFTEIQRGFPAEILQFKQLFQPKTGDLQKKTSSPQKCHEIRSQSTKTTKIPLANTNLGLDLHSSSPEPVNFFGAQSSHGGTIFIWGGTSSQLGGHSPVMPPVAPGLPVGANLPLRPIPSLLLLLPLLDFTFCKVLSVLNIMMTVDSLFLPKVALLSIYRLLKPLSSKLPTPPSAE